MDKNVLGVLVLCGLFSLVGGIGILIDMWKERRRE